MLLALSPTDGLAQTTQTNKCTRLNNTGAFACSGRVISWIEVRVEGDLLKSRQQEFEQLARRRLQDELPYLGHEKRRFVDAARDTRGQPIADVAAFRAQRGEMMCFIWTVGTEYPVPVFVECTLSGWGVGLKMTNEFSARFLGAGPPDDIPRLAEDGIRHAVAQIASKLLSERQEWRRPLP